MSDAEGKISCSATPQLTKSQEVKAIMGESRGGFEVGVFHVVLTDKDGNVLYEDYARNGTTTEFAKEIWNTVRTSSPSPVSLGQTSRTLHIHCYTNSAAATGPTLLVADTYATSVGGTGASFDTSTFAPTTGTGWVAQTWAPSAPTGTSTVEITAAAVAFTGSAQSNAVVGAYVYSQADGGGAGVLVSTANFSSGISDITASDTLSVTFTSGLLVS